MVVAGGTFFAFAISRSYFEVGGLPNGPLLRSSRSALSVSMKGPPLHPCATWRLRSFRLDRRLAEGTSARLRAAAEPASTPNSRATSFIRCLSSAENSPRAPSACLTSSNAATPGLLHRAGSIDGIAASAAFWSSSSMLNCSRTSALKSPTTACRRAPGECGARPRSRARRPRPAPCRHRGARGSRLRAGPRAGCAT